VALLTKNLRSNEQKELGMSNVCRFSLGAFFAMLMCAGASAIAQPAATDATVTMTASGAVQGVATADVISCAGACLNR
jgi:hypothetical protein